MAESAEVTVRKASIISLCQADTNYSQHGGSIIHHIDTLHQFKRFQNLVNVNGHDSQSMPKLLFSLILPWMPVTLTPLMMLL